MGNREERGRRITKRIKNLFRRIDILTIFTVVTDSQVTYMHMSKFNKFCSLNIFSSLPINCTSVKGGGEFEGNREADGAPVKMSLTPLL